MINIKYPNKNLSFCKNACKKCTKIVQPFFKHAFFFYKQIKGNLGGDDDDELEFNDASTLLGH